MMNPTTRYLRERRRLLKILATGAAASGGGITQILAQGVAPGTITRDSAHERRYG